MEQQQEQMGSKHVFVGATGVVYTKKLPASEINRVMAMLPQAELLDLVAVTPLGQQKVAEFKTVRVTLPNRETHFVYCPKLRYNVVQHEEAFRPVIEGLTGSDFDFIMRSTPGRASLNIFSKKAGYDGVQLGISVTNSFDGSTRVFYGFALEQKMTTVELVGYRQVCSNGMKIRVPLDKAEFTKLEEREKIVSLAKKSFAIVHTRTASEKIAKMQAVTEALSVLKSPVERLIKRAQKWTIADSAILEDLIKVYVGKRHMQKVIAQFALEEQSLWGLYNAMTNFATHEEKLTENARESLQDRASDLLLHQIVEPRRNMSKETD